MRRYVKPWLVGAVAAGLFGVAAGGCSPRPRPAPERPTSSQQAEEKPSQKQPKQPGDKAGKDGGKVVPPKQDSEKDKRDLSKGTPPSPPFGSWKQFEALHAMIRPHADEAPWANLPWETDLYQARKKAAAEGKPIFVWSANADPIGCT